jgi:hypothetical protein
MPRTSWSRFRRDEHGKITEACVRLIDANPRGIPQHGLLELGRLLHWLELGSTLRASRQRGRPLIEVHFQGAETGHQFLNEAPRLEYVEPERSATQRSYQVMLQCLGDALPEVKLPPARDMLSLGIGLYHLIAARFWPRNHDRVCAFWAGVNEIRRLGNSGRVEPDNGLWNVRRQRGRLPY